MTILEARDIVKTYRQGGLFGAGRAVRAVDGVSLALEPGKCLALLGPSGSGKSTLARILLGLEAPDSGSVLYKGQSLRRFTGDARRNVQAVFQNSQGAVNPRFSARDIVAEPLVNFDSLHGKGLDHRVAKLLAEVGISPEEMGKRPHQFSGGELQRICLARALASRPEVVILDEAVSSLDMLNQSRALSTLSRIQKRYGTAFLFITHDMRVAASVADSAVFMENGSITLRIDDLDSIPAEQCAASALYRELAEAVLPFDVGAGQKEQPHEQ